MTMSSKTFYFDKTASISLKMSAESYSPLLHRATTVNNAKSSLPVWLVWKVHWQEVHEFQRRASALTRYLQVAVLHSRKKLLSTLEHCHRVNLQSVSFSMIESIAKTQNLSSVVHFCFPFFYFCFPYSFIFQTACNSYFWKGLELDTPCSNSQDNSFFFLCYFHSFFFLHFFQN